MTRKPSAQEELTRIAGMGLHEIQEEFVSLAELQRHIMPDPERLTVFGGLRYLRYDPAGPRW